MGLFIELELDKQAKGKVLPHHGNVQIVLNTKWIVFDHANLDKK